MKKLLLILDEDQHEGNEFSHKKLVRREFIIFKAPTKPYGVLATLL